MSANADLIKSARLLTGLNMQIGKELAIKTINELADALETAEALNKSLDAVAARYQAAWHSSQTTNAQDLAIYKKALELAGEDFRKAGIIGGGWLPKAIVEVIK